MRRMFFLALLVTTGCAEAHGRFDDGGAPDARTECAGRPSAFCVTACGSDAGYAEICVDGAWTCPPEAPIDAATCPPTCVGPPPADCVCDEGAWRCVSGECPSDINPFDPMDPASICFVEGASCSSGDDPCGSAIFCTCMGGRWQCGIAEPDPVCFCGREPSAGDRCIDEGTICGSCCPTPDAPPWPPMACLGGRWEPADCPDVECPPLVEECPVDTSAAVGTVCGIEGQLCGNPCCDSAITCTAGRWRRGPFAGCACEPDHACGEGSCTTFQACAVRCGPDDGPEHYCVGLPEGCFDCSCVPLRPDQTCEMIDGRPAISDPLFCG
ncbi:MAG: hypothetical protein KC619_13540 [Myxococcales bacterium]|nr:hypothetical protein [Myxococcales bacterium]